MNMYHAQRTTSRASIIVLSTIAVAVILLGTPLYSQAATTSKTTTTTTVTISSTASISAKSLQIDSGDEARISGTTTSAVKKVRVTLTSVATKKVVYTSSRTSVKSSGTWTTKKSKELADGAYTVTVYDATKSSSSKIVLTTGTLQVGKPAATLKVSSIPLLTGGTTNPGSTFPVSYLQVVNTSNTPVTIKGFWLQQTGTAPTTALIGFSSVDDKGLSRASIGGMPGFTAFTNGRAYVPSTAVLAAGERKLFTIKAQLSPTAAPNAGSTISLVVSGVDASATISGVLPIGGTTWTITR